MPTNEFASRFTVTPGITASPKSMRLLPLASRKTPPLMLPVLGPTFSRSRKLLPPESNPENTVTWSELALISAPPVPAKAATLT